MEISVIIPTYNSADVILDCVDSIVSQDFQNIEILIVDDGSTDGTASVLTDLLATDKRIKYFWQQNKGVSAARNIGIMNAKGDLIIFADADDQFPENILYLYAETFFRKKYDICIGDFLNVDNKGKSLIRTLTTQPGLLGVGDRLALLSGCIDGVGFDGKHPTKMMGAVWAKAFSRKFLMKNKLQFDEGLSQAEDIHFMFRALSLASNYYYLGKVSYIYYVNKLSSSHRKDSKIKYELSKFLAVLSLEVDRVNDPQLRNDFYCMVMNEVIAILRRSNETRKYSEMKSLLKIQPFKEASKKISIRRFGRVKENIKIFAFKALSQIATIF